MPETVFDAVRRLSHETTASKAKPATNTQPQTILEAVKAICDQNKRSARKLLEIK